MKGKHAVLKATISTALGFLALVLFIAAFVVALVLEVELFEAAWRIDGWRGLLFAFLAQVLIVVWVAAWVHFRFGDDGSVPPKRGRGSRSSRGGSPGGGGVSGYVVRQAVFSSLGRNKK